MTIVPRGTLAPNHHKTLWEKRIAHVELRWLAAVCQMTMFHVEQFIRSKLKEMWEKVNGSCRVEVVGCSVSDDNVPRGTIHHKSARRAVGKVNGSCRVEEVGCSVSDDTCSTWNNPSEIT